MTRPGVLWVVLTLTSGALAGCAEPAPVPAAKASSPVPVETWDPLDGGLPPPTSRYGTVLLDYPGNTGAETCLAGGCYGRSLPTTDVLTNGEASENSTYRIGDLAGFRAVNLTLTWDAEVDLRMSAVGIVPLDQNLYRIHRRANVTGPSPLSLSAAFEAWSSRDDGAPAVIVDVPTGIAENQASWRDGYAFRVTGHAVGVKAAADA